MMFIVIILLLLGIYYFNKNYECFDNKDIIDLIEVYDLLINEKNENNKNKIKEEIIKTIQNIEIKITNDYDKYTITNYLYNDIIKLLNNYNKTEFEKIINKIKVIIDKSTEKTEIIMKIKKNFIDLTELYSLNNYNKYKTQIDYLTSNIYNSLLKLTDYDTLNNSGIILIFNKNLKKAYEINDITQINSEIATFNEFIKKLGYNKEILINRNIEFPSIVVNKNKDVIKLIQNNFNEIYNAFDLININYLNNGSENELNKLKIIIYSSIDEIISYYENTSYKEMISSIKNGIIKPILENEIRLSYKTIDENEIIKTQNKFYDAILEIKNIIITYYSKN